jgi:hypothetical protein
VVIVGVAVISATLGPEVSGTLMVGGVALVLVIMQLVTLRRFDRSMAGPPAVAGEDGS